MTTTRHTDGVTETPSIQTPAGIPGRTAPILFGFAGAWWASNKAKSLGVTDTKRYWIIAAISTGVSMLAGLLLPVLFLFSLSASLGGGSAFNDPADQAPLSDSAVNAPVPPAPVGPILPEGDSPEDIIRAVENYRALAFATGSSALLTKYFDVGNNEENDRLYNDTVKKVDLVVPENLVGHVKMSITKIVIVSATPIKIVANVSVHDSVDGRVMDDFTYNGRVYEVVNGRWLATYTRTMT